jgi:hypothetical protein
MTQDQIGEGLTVVARLQKPAFLTYEPEQNSNGTSGEDHSGSNSRFIHAPTASGYQVLNVSPPDFLDEATLGQLFSKRVVVPPPRY